MAHALLLAVVCLSAAAHAVLLQGGAPYSEEAVCAPPSSGRPTGACTPPGKCPGVKDTPSCGLPASASELQCCAQPTSTGPQIGARSRKACQDFEKAKQRCDENFPPPASGSDVRQGDFPYFAGLGYETKSGNGKTNWHCGGALISEKFVLTAATCAHGSRSTGGPIKVRLGDVSFLKDDAKRPGADVPRPDAEVQELDVAEIIAHPAYNKTSKLNDIALLRLSGTAHLTKNVRPACLFPEERLPVGRAIVAGFGARAPDGAGDIGTLAKVDVPLVPLEKCAEIYKEFKITLDSTVQCAGEKGRDTCIGDSGAPLVVKEGAPTCNYQIVGITSFGPRVCGNVPAIYTKIHAFLPWIEEKVWN